MKIWKDTELEWLYDENLTGNWMELEANLEDHEGEGWRVPNITDVMTLIDYSNFDLAIKDSCPINMEFAWCIEEYSKDPINSAWCVCFTDGHVYPSTKTNARFPLYVR